MGKSLRVLFAFSLALSASTTAWAYEVRRTESGSPVHWDQSRIGICLGSSLERLGDEKDVQDVIAEALATWEGSGYFPATFDVTECGDLGGGTIDSRDGRNEVVAIDGPWPYTSHANAVTLVTFESGTGRILDADIVFSSALDWSVADQPEAGTYDLLDTATHEVGHLVGLAHSDDPTATMYQVVTPGSTERRTLADDDINGLIAIYGTAPPLGRVATAGCSAVPTGRHGLGGWLPVAALLLVSSARRRRRALTS